MDALETMTDSEVKAAAIADGWAEVEQDPDPTNTGCGPTGPCLYHAGLDRVFPIGDWRGALADITD